MNGDDELDFFNDNPSEAEHVEVGLQDTVSEAGSSEWYDSEHDISPLIASLDDEVAAGKHNAQEASAAQPSSSVLPSTPTSMKRKASTPLFTPMQPKNLFKSEDSSPKRPRIQSGEYYEPIDLNWDALMNSILGSMPVGVQFELTRFVHAAKRQEPGTSNSAHSVLRFSDFLVEDLQKLCSKTNVEAMSLFPGILRDTKARKLGADSSRLKDDVTEISEGFYEKEIAAHKPWEELDKEAKVLEAKDTLGLMGFDSEGNPAHWYGGKVVFRGSLEKTSDNIKSFNIKLAKPELGPSTHLTRRFGSRSLFRLKVNGDLLGPGFIEPLMNYIRRPILMCGRVFRAFYAKEMSVLYTCTDEAPLNGQINSTKRLDGMSFMEFINWANPPQENATQGISKYCSRFALLLSTSVPGCLLKPDQVHMENDILSDTNSNMTDGAGSIGRSIMSQLFRHFNWLERPSAIQVRVFGSKGLLVDDKLSDIDQERIYLTPSQIKIKYAPSDTDPARRVIDVLRVSHIKPCRNLGVETIINLAENGVSAAVFASLFRQNTAEFIEQLLDWDAPDSCLRLWKVLDRIGGVVVSRRARENPGKARFCGYSEHDMDEEEADEDDDGLRQSGYSVHQSVAWWPDPVGGSPSSMEETVMDLLSSGFHPRCCPMLADKMRRIVKGKMENRTFRYKIEVPMSCLSMIVPDKRGILEEGEIFFRSSSHNLLLPDGTEKDIVIGEVLISRHPCKLPTDVQKCKAVFKSGLRDYIDVIVLSTKGLRRAADYLGGGDYDGDKAQIIWEPTIVNAFNPPSQSFADPPDDRFIKENFDTGVDTTVKDLLDGFQRLPSEERIYRLQEHLLGSLRDRSLVGMYSNFHENAVQMLGYQHPETIRNGHMFCLVLDSVKSGLKVKREVFERDKKKYEFQPPEWKRSMKKEACYVDGPNYDYRLGPINRSTSKPFIMEELFRHMQNERVFWNQHIDNFFEARDAVDCGEDEDLARPYREICEKTKGPYGELFELDLNRIKSHVQKVYQAQELSKGSNFTSLPIEGRQNRLRALSRDFANGPDPTTIHMLLSDTIARVRASYAYVYDREVRKGMSENWSRNPWNVAFRELCDIKAKAGLSKTIADQFHQYMNLKLPRQTQT